MEGVLRALRLFGRAAGVSKEELVVSAPACKARFTSSFIGAWSASCDQTDGREQSVSVVHVILSRYAHSYAGQRLGPKTPTDGYIVYKYMTGGVK